MQAMSQGEYVFTATSATAGVLEISTVDWNNNPIVYEYQYSELTENSFKIDSNFLYGGVTGDEITWIKFTLSPVNIEFEDMYDSMY